MSTEKDQEEINTLRRALVDCLVLPWSQIAVDPIRAAIDHQNAVIAMRAEIEQLHRGEYICIKCGLRHDSDLPKGYF